MTTYTDAPADLTTAATAYVRTYRKALDVESVTINEHGGVKVIYLAPGAQEGTIVRFRDFFSAHEIREFWAKLAADTPNTTHTAALAIADRLWYVLSDLNALDGTYAVEQDGRPYGATKNALLAVLYEIYGGTGANDVYESCISSGERPSIVARRV